MRSIDIKNDRPHFGFAIEKETTHKIIAHPQVIRKIKLEILVRIQISKEKQGELKGVGKICISQL